MSLALKLKCELPLATEKVAPKLLRYSDVPHSVDTFADAFSNDPLFHYLRDTPDAGKNRSEIPNRTKSALTLANAVRKRVAWSVDGGDAVILYSPASVAVPRGKKIVNAIVTAILSRIMQLFVVFLTPEQKKRKREFEEKLTAALKEALGDKIAELVSLDLLATAPERQGRGYASSLVGIVTDIADAQSRGTWVLTNLYTEGFYEQFGFRTIRTISLGESNPTWTEKPIILCLMLRDSSALGPFS